MRGGFGALARCGLALLALACKSEPPAPPAPLAAPSALAAPSQPPVTAPLSSEVVAFEKSLQATKLLPGPLAPHAPRVAFGKGVVALLGVDALRVFDANEPRLLASEPLEAPRALLALTDGSLLALGARATLHWRPGHEHARVLPRVVLWPDAEVYADALQPDLLWVFEQSRGGGAAQLSSFRLAASGSGVLLPEQRVELAAARDSVLGFTREGVWIHLTPGRGERFAPGGGRLPGFTFERAPLPTWVLPAQLLDQSLWLDASGQLERVQLLPRFERRSRVTLAGSPFAADVGDQGRLLAVIAIHGDGPRFELQLFDAELRATAPVALPAEAPTGAEDWVRVVTRNQQLAVNARAPRVAIGGPDRLAVYDAAGHVVFSIPSM